MARRDDAPPARRGPRRGRLARLALLACAAPRATGAAAELFADWWGGGGADPAAAAPAGAAFLRASAFAGADPAFAPVVSGAPAPVSLTTALGGEPAGLPQVALAPGLAVPVQVKLANADEAQAHTVTFLAMPAEGAEDLGVLALGVAGAQGASGVAVPAGGEVDVQVPLYVPPGTPPGATAIHLLAVDGAGRASGTTDALRVAVREASMRVGALLGAPPAAPTVGSGGGAPVPPPQARRLGPSDNELVFRPPQAGGCSPAVEALATSGRTGAFLAAAQSSGALAGGGFQTVFAPSDEALAGLAGAIGIDLEQLLASPNLKALVKHHLTAAPPNAISAGRSFDSLMAAAVAVERTADGVAVGGCAVAEKALPVCEGGLFILECILPPPSPAAARAAPEVEAMAGPSPATGAALNEGADDYDYEESFDLAFAPDGVAPDGVDIRFPAVPPQQPQAAPAARGNATQPGGPSGGGAAAHPRNAGLAAELEAASTGGVARPEGAAFAAANLEISDLEGAAIEGTFLPPGWNEWIEIGTADCPGGGGGGSAGCQYVQAQSGRSCAGVQRACGALREAGASSYNFQPPLSFFDAAGFAQMGEGTYVWQPVAAESTYCTPMNAGEDGFGPALVHEAWVEADPGLDVSLMLLRNTLDAEPWAVVAVSTGHSKNDLEMAPSVRHVRHRGAGCYRWIVASQSGAGRYRFYFTADLD